MQDNKLITIKNLEGNGYERGVEGWGMGGEVGGGGGGGGGGEGERRMREVEMRGICRKSGGEKKRENKYLEEMYGAMTLHDSKQVSFNTSH